MSIDICSFDAFIDSPIKEDRLIQVRLWQNETLTLPAKGTHFGFVWKGTAQLKRASLSVLFPLPAGMYFSASEAVTIGGQNTVGIVVSQLKHASQFMIGGPIKSVGRFPYIDGGTTSLLVAPMAAGDPCLHALYMPPNVDQTMHSHPSDRTGIIINGSGQCCDEHTCHSLTPGTLFHISANHQHRFVTGSQGLDLVVFHPDSDVGFSDRNHPMLRRTLVNNISATELSEIQTTL
ncbi:MAG: cupin domain-containing protein [Cyanobacteria bacterium P01_D01_bin.1]